MARSQILGGAVIEGVPVRGLTPPGHKIALRDIAKGDPIIKYGERMGHAFAPIARGAHVHTQNVIGDRVSTEPTA